MDNELFKAIVNGGSFALIVLFFVWLLLKAEPNYRKTIEKVMEEAKEMIQKASEENRRAMEVVCATFQTALSNQLTECRAERKELFEALQEEAEKNRQSRHDFANMVQRAVAEGCENRPPPKR